MLFISCENNTGSHSKKFIAKDSADTANTASDTEMFISKDSTNTNEMKNTLFVFIGEKIEVKELAGNDGDLDNGYLAKYKVLQKIDGEYSEDIIEFEAYDHYGFPHFANDKNVMLFVSKEKGKYYQEKYQYFPLFKTKDNRWASPYPTGDYTDKTTIQPLIMNFKEEVFYDITGRDKKEMRGWYTEPYYKIEGDKAIAVYGNYIPELFELKKEGVLKNRGLF